MTTTNTKKDSWIPVWSSLAKLGNSKIIKSSYFWIFFVPIMAKLLESAPNTICIGTIENCLRITLALPFSWVAFYFSSLFFGIALLIYYWKCPIILRNVDSWSVFTKKGLTIEWLLSQFANWLRNNGQIYTAEGDLVPHREEVQKIQARYGTELSKNQSISEPVWKSAKYLH